MSKIPKLIKIVVVEPLGEINLGSIARLCENFGVDELRLVSPRCDPMNPEAMKMAVHGKEFLKNSHVFSNLLDAINDCVRIVATCGRVDHGSIPIHSSKSALQWIQETTSNKPVAIVAESNFINPSPSIVKSPVPRVKPAEGPTVK